MGFTSTNHTAEDQLVIVYGEKFYEGELKNLIDNTELYNLMCNYLAFNYLNPKMDRQDAIAYVKAISYMEWERHLRLHIS